MASKKRVYREKEIEIERNVVEAYLMEAREIIRKYRKPVLYTFIGLVVGIVLLVASALYIEKVNARNLARFESIMGPYMESAVTGDGADSEKTVKELKSFISDTRFGFSRKMAFYALGNIYFDTGNYGEAKKYLLQFSKKSSSTTFTSIALLKAAIAAEEEGTLNESLKIYKKLEKKYAFSLVADQIYYNLARVYKKKGDSMNTRKYYNKVITEYPQSMYAQDAKERLFLINK